MVSVQGFKASLGNMVRSHLNKTKLGKPENKAQSPKEGPLRRR
jgi:hypothetical protein